MMNHILCRCLTWIMAYVNEFTSTEFYYPFLINTFQMMENKSNIYTEHNYVKILFTLQKRGSL